MSVQVDTLSITVPGHVVRKNSEGSDTVLVLTGAQAAYVFESLSEVSSLFVEHLTPVETVVPAAAQAETGEVVKLASVTAGKASE
jgi:hypothetical protein